MGKQLGVHMDVCWLGILDSKICHHGSNSFNMMREQLILFVNLANYVQLRLRCPHYVEQRRVRHRHRSALVAIRSGRLQDHHSCGEIHFTSLATSQGQRDFILCLCISLSRSLVERRQSRLLLVLLGLNLGLLRTSQRRGLHSARAIECLDRLCAACVAWRLCGRSCARPARWLPAFPGLAPPEVAARAARHGGGTPPTGL
mmetsp:Transcript_2934/g.7629  ORF Transcript_2934/g.7629 Transcript_2934/m.7629 type:complete len:201 (-) Transcript_2934:14-616(-)